MIVRPAGCGNQREAQLASPRTSSRNCDPATSGFRKRRDREPLSGQLQARRANGGVIPRIGGGGAGVRLQPVRASPGTGGSLSCFGIAVPALL